MDSKTFPTGGNGKTKKQGSINVYSSGGNIVLDGNSLVVGMSRKMDTQLGKMSVAKGRGNV